MLWPGALYSSLQRAVALWGIIDPLQHAAMACCKQLIQQGAACLPRDIHQFLAIPPRVTFLKSLLIAVFVQWNLTYPNLKYSPAWITWPQSLCILFNAHGGQRAK